jgi:hypothetical protein
VDGSEAGEVKCLRFEFFLKYLYARNMWPFDARKAHIIAINRGSVAIYLNVVGQSLSLVI